MECTGGSQAGFGQLTGAAPCEGVSVPAAEVSRTGSVTARDSREWSEWQVFLTAVILPKASGLQQKAL